MEQIKTLLSVRSSNGNSPYDAIRGLQLSLNGEVTSSSIVENEFRFRNGYLDIGRIPELENGAPFTLEAVIIPNRLSGERQIILEAHAPAISLSIDENGYLNGSIHTQSGWQTVSSNVAFNTTTVPTPVRFSRDAQGDMVLEINNTVAGTRNVSGEIVNLSQPSGFRAGMAIDNSAAFNGSLRNINILLGANTTAFAQARQQQADLLAATIKKKINTKASVEVVLNAGTAQSMLQPIKQIMNTAGVQHLNDLDTLRITQPLTIPQGTLLIAQTKTQANRVDWQTLAGEFDSLTKEQQQMQLAAYLLNQNSAAFLQHTKNSLRISGDTPPILAPKPADNVLRATVAEEVEDIAIAIPDGTDIDQLLEQVTSISPEEWPALGGIVNLQTAANIPINSSVIIAGTLDLTNTTLTIEPNVEKLYIIAEKVICGPNARITWRRPGGTTPPRADDPGLHGFDWTGIHTKPNSKEGMDGGNGFPAGPGLTGARGRNAPALEMWVKDLSNVPNIDLNGEEGIQGGTGQRGGDGGRGADGGRGHTTCVIVHCWCDSQGGNGGRGGAGGNGGTGGRGGMGGNGGNITIAVLLGTLGSTVGNNEFRIKNEGGRVGRGGVGGAGGAGGEGGQPGNTRYCTRAVQGETGTPGSLGSTGPESSIAGHDAVNFFTEFTEQEWDELLTRPFITDISPWEVFPGNSITIKGYKFQPADRVIIDGISTPFAPVINPDQSISITLPANISGGQKSVYVVRNSDGLQSNRIPIWVKPQLDTVPDSFAPATKVTITGKAFMLGATVLLNGAAIPPDSVQTNTIVFETPGVSGGQIGRTVELAVRNPDGLVSNIRTSVVPHILGIDFRYGTHNLKFGNFKDGAPSWGTFDDTFGTAEIWRELLDPVFGHPILTAAYYEFYHFFLKGTTNGGLATGYCTSLSSIVADNFWQGRTDTHTLEKVDLLDKLTAVHGKLLSRETLLHFHAQSHIGIPMVEKTARTIERAFLVGCDRYTMPLLFFIPIGEVWDAGYIDTLADTHCIMPYRFVYPPGHSGPQLSPDGSTTTTDLEGVELFCWDCNNIDGKDCRLRFFKVNGVLHYEYIPGGSSVQFDISKNITLGNMTNGAYMLADHDLPFSGPFGLTSFIVDFLLSAADLRVTNASGLQTGKFGNTIKSEIPDSHPCYLVKGAYLLPTGQGYIKQIVGNETGSYTYTSILPDGTTIRLENIDTEDGHIDTLYVNADTSQLVFTPQTTKNFTVTFSRRINDQVRSLAVHGLNAGPEAGISMSVSPQLDMVRLGNNAGQTLAQVKTFVIEKTTNTPVNRRVLTSVPASHDLVVTVPDWNTAMMRCTVVPFTDPES